LLASSFSLASAVSSISSRRARRVSSSSSCGIESISVRIIAQASSTRSIALSGRNRSEMYRLERTTALTSALSWIRTPWCSSKRSRRPRRIEIASSTLGLVHDDRLEAALERGVLLDVLAVLVERGRADAVQLAPGQHRLEQVAGVHRAVGLAGADDQVELVDEEDDPAVALLDLLQDGLEALLEFAAVLGAGHEGAHVEGEDGPVLQALRHVAAQDPLGQALDDRRLADAGLADQDRVVLGLAGKDADRAADLLVAADDRVELALAAWATRSTPYFSSAW
jgi:hypothetical protein